MKEIRQLIKANDFLSEIKTAGKRRTKIRIVKQINCRITQHNNPNSVTKCKLYINRTSAEQSDLIKLWNVGPVTANAIIRERELSPFLNARDLRNRIWRITTRSIEESPVEIYFETNVSRDVIRRLRIPDRLRDSHSKYKDEFLLVGTRIDDRYRFLTLQDILTLLTKVGGRCSETNVKGFVNELEIAADGSGWILDLGSYAELLEMETWNRAMNGINFESRWSTRPGRPRMNSPDDCTEQWTRLMQNRHLQPSSALQNNELGIQFPTQRCTSPQSNKPKKKVKFSLTSNEFY